MPSGANWYRTKIMYIKNVIKQAALTLRACAKNTTGIHIHTHTPMRTIRDSADPVGFYVRLKTHSPSPFHRCAGIRSPSLREIWRRPEFLNVCFVEQTKKYTRTISCTGRYSNMMMNKHYSPSRGSFAYENANNFDRCLSLQRRRYRLLVVYLIVSRPTKSFETFPYLAAVTMVSFTIRIASPKFNYSCRT